MWRDALGGAGRPVRGRVVAVILLVLIANAGSGMADELSQAALAELRERLARGATGTVEGRIYLEPTRLGGADDPLVGVGLLVVPRSPELLERLTRLKRESRESLRAFREAAPAVREAVEAYESALWRAGFPDATARTATDAAGAFRLQVPAGAWLLVAERRVFLPVHATHATPQPSATALDPFARYSASQYQHFLPTARMRGFDAVSLWLREIDVEVGQRVALELHDRGVWLSGVAEETELPRRTRFTGRGRKN